MFLYKFVVLTDCELSGAVYELAVVLSMKIGDQDAFEREFVQLKVFYMDTRFVSYIITFWSYVLHRSSCIAKHFKIYVSYFSCAITFIFAPKNKLPFGTFRSWACISLRQSTSFQRKL